MIYIDPWVGNPKAPSDFTKVPDDADLVLVTHGHFDHAKDAPELVKASKKQAKVVCNGDIYRFYQKTAEITEA